MLRRSVLAAAAALTLVPAAAEAKEATFNVSLYGVQRYEQVDHETEAPAAADECFDARGEAIQTTEVRFATRKPVRMRVTHDGSYVSMTPLKDNGDSWPLMVDSTWKHAYDGNREVKDCTNEGPDWGPDIVPLARGCDASIDWMGFGVNWLGGGRLEAVGGEGLHKPMGAGPFDDCPWGDHSMSLYAAKGRIAPKLLLSGRETEVVLRGRERDKGDRSTGDWTSYDKKTTVYVTFKKVTK